MPFTAQILLVPLTITSLFNVVTLPALIVSFRNVVTEEPCIDCAVPAKITDDVVVVPLYVPFFIQLPVSVNDAAPLLIVPFELIVIFPETVVVLLIVSAAVTAPPRVNDLHTAVADIVGWLTPVKFASPIIASVVAVGTPFVQFVARAQLVLIVPFQLVCENDAILHTDRNTRIRIRV